jgi:hypothetical protein
MTVLPAKRMSHGVQPWPVERDQAEGMSLSGAVLGGARAGAAAAGLRYEVQGRAQRGLNLLLTHFTTGSSERPVIS